MNSFKAYKGKPACGPDGGDGGRGGNVYFVGDKDMNDLSQCRFIPGDGAGQIVQLLPLVTAAIPVSLDGIAVNILPKKDQIGVLRLTEFGGGVGPHLNAAALAGAVAGGMVVGPAVEVIS